MGPCAECGFVYDEAQAATAAGGILEEVATIASTLVATARGELTRRPEPGTWSRLEYACHLRDVLLVQRERVLLARRVDEPEIVPMGRDERVEHDGYSQQDPADVARQLRDAAALLGNDLDRLGDGDWSRTVVYQYPERAVRSLRWVATHTLHDAVHHALDIRRQS